MTFIDLGIVISIGYNAIVGAKRGLVRLLFDTLAMFGGIVIAIAFYERVGALIAASTGIQASYSLFAGFIVIWVASFACFSIIGIILHRIVNLVLLGPVNIVGGTAVGAFRGFCFLLPFLVPMTYFQFAPLEESKIGSQLQPVVRWVTENLLPKDTLGQFKITPQMIKNVELETLQKEIKDKSNKKLTQTKE